MKNWLVRPIILRATCVAVLGLIFFAGLWPFNPFPPNDVHWLANESGLSFGRNHGIAISSAPLKAPADASASSLEIWLEPASDRGMHYFLSFYSPATPNQLSFRQYFNELELQSGSGKTWAEEAFHLHEKTFITLTSGPKGTTIYLDGIRVQNRPHLSLDRGAFQGEMIIGTAPENLRPWPGSIHGLAIYNRELAPDEVYKHYKVWTHAEDFESLEHEAVALYKFDERTGNIVHDRGTSGPDLKIPASFTLPYATMLDMPWTGRGSTSSYISDLAINVVGFIPFGFFFCAWLSIIRRDPHANLATIVLGALVSLTIEVLQTYLPTRDSDLTDVMTNTIGTAIGVMLYATLIKQRVSPL